MRKVSLLIKHLNVLLHLSNVDLVVMLPKSNKYMVVLMLHFQQKGHRQIGDCWCFRQFRIRVQSGNIMAIYTLRFGVAQKWLDQPFNFIYLVAIYYGLYTLSTQLKWLLRQWLVDQPLLQRLSRLVFSSRRLFRFIMYIC